MHILLIHQIFVTPSEGGGTRHYELAKYLVQKGHRVTIIASDTDYLTADKKGKNKETREGIDIIYSSTYQAVQKTYFRRGISFLSFAFSSFINAVKVRDVDVMWGTSPPLFQSLTTLVISKLKRVPFVFEIRDLWIDFAEELGIVKNPLLVRSIKLLEKILYRSSRRILVNSPGFIPYIAKYVREDKIYLIPNGVTTSEFETDNSKKSDFRSQHNLNNKFIAIYLGNIGVANDIETIIRSAEQLREIEDIIFVIMGGGIKKEYFKKYILQNKLSNILVLDAQPKSEIPRILSEVDVCIATLKNIPLFKTTYPNKVFDYMASKKPTILAIDGVIRNVIELSNGGTFVNPGSSRELANAVLRYYRTPDLKAIHGRNASNYVKKYFEREKVSDELEKIMLSLVFQFQRVN